MHVSRGIRVRVALEVVGWEAPSSHWMLSLRMLSPKWLLPLVMCIGRQCVALRRHRAVVWECLMLGNGWRKPAHVPMDHGRALLAEGVGTCHRDRPTRALRTSTHRACAARSTTSHDSVQLHIQNFGGGDIRRVDDGLGSVLASTNQAGPLRWQSDKAALPPVKACVHAVLEIARC